MSSSTYEINIKGTKLKFSKVSFLRIQIIYANLKSLGAYRKYGGFLKIQLLKFEVLKYYLHKVGVKIINDPYLEALEY